MPTRSAATLDVVVTTERLACSFCRGRKRKCNGKLEGCWRNFDWMPTNVSPRSRPASLHLRHLLPLPSTSLTPLDSLVMLMDQISIWDPLDTVPLKHTSWYLAKSAHRSTADDVVVKSYLLTTSGYDMEVIDRHTVLESLHDYPDILRLSICAFCSHFAKPSAPDMVTRSYYSSARELAHLCIDVPSLNYLKALLLLVFCGLALGDHGACIAFADMAFRMASLLKLDTPELLRLPSGNIPTPKEMAIRDRLWRVCVLYDNVLIATIRSGLLPRFFQYGGNDARPMLNPQYFTHISCDDESRTAFVHHLSTLSHALYKIRRTIAEIQEVKHADTSNVRRFWEALRTAQAMLEEWETTVPLSILHQKSEDITPFRFVGSNGYHFNGDTCYRVSLKLMYLAAQCHLGNAVRKLSREPFVGVLEKPFIFMTARGGDVRGVADSAAWAVGGVAARYGRMEFHPIMAIAMFAAGRWLGEGLFEARKGDGVGVGGGEGSEGKRKEVIRVLGDVMVFMKGLCEEWRIVKVGLKVFEGEFEERGDGKE